MPTYTYKCEKCGEFDEFHSINDTLEECPTCKSAGIKSDKPTKLIAGGTTFILTGSGWASSGYSNK